MVRLTLEQGSGPLTLLAVLAVALLLATVGYRRSFGHLPVRRWRWLLGLRAASVVVVVLLLFQPVLRFERAVSERRALVVLLDQSASMATADDATGVSRFDQARREVLDWSGRLTGDVDLRVIAFADRAVALERPGDVSRLKPDGSATSLTRALSASARGPGSEAIEAVVVFSDGVHNAAGDPVPVARQLGRVVHTVGVGNSLRTSPSYRDVAVVGVECPDQLPVNNQARIQARVAQAGLTGHVVQAVLEEDGKPVATSEVELRAGDAPQDVAFAFVPATKGRRTYTVRIPSVQGEKIAENNHRSVAALVVDAKIRVLYVEGTLRAEYGALVQRFFSKDPDIEFAALVRTRPGVYLMRSNRPGLQLKGIPDDPALIDSFDVVVIGDLDSDEWRPGPLELLMKRVREGAGLLMIGGYHSLGPGGYGATPLADALPVVTGDRAIGQVTEPFVPELTPAGRAHPVFANIARFFPSSAGAAEVPGLPPLDGCTRVAGAKPGATVLAVRPASPGEASPMPVLAVQPFGKGRAAVFTGDTTRNWQQGPRAMDQESPFLRFWGQIIRWLADRSQSLGGGAGVVARTDKAYYEPDVPVTVEAVVRDKEGEGTEKARVSARVRGPEGEEEPFELGAVAGATGTYRGTFEPKTPGTHEIAVEASLEGQTLKAEPVAAEIGRPNLEFDRLDLDEPLLTRLASATGGRYRHISTASRLIDDLDRTARSRRASFETPLAWPGPFWALLVGLLTTEWALRKRSQLR